jgi:hypothetical protein
MLVVQKNIVDTFGKDVGNIIFEYYAYIKINFRSTSEYYDLKIEDFIIWENVSPAFLNFCDIEYVHLDRIPRPFIVRNIYKHKDYGEVKKITNLNCYLCIHSNLNFFVHFSASFSYIQENNYAFFLCFNFCEEHGKVLKYLENRKF